MLRTSLATWSFAKALKLESSSTTPLQVARACSHDTPLSAQSDCCTSPKRPLRAARALSGAAGRGQVGALPSDPAQK